MLAGVERDGEGSDTVVPAEPAGRADLSQRFWAAAGAFPAGASPREVVRRACAALAALQAGGLGAGGRSGAGLGGAPALLAELAEEGLGPYAAPELVRGDAFDERALVFAVGVLVFERLTAHHPFGSTQDVRVARLRRGELGSGVNYFPAVPGQLRTILLRAMGPFPEVRYERLAALQADLTRFAESGGEQPSPKPVRKARATASAPAAPTGTAPAAASGQPAPAPAPALGVTRHAPRQAPRTAGGADGRAVAAGAEPPLGPQAVQAPAGAVGPAAPRRPRSGRPLPRWLVPGISFLAGSAVATAILVLVSPAQPPVVVRAPAPRAPAVVAPRAPAVAPRAPQPTPKAAAPIAPPSARHANGAATDEPPPLAAARRVLALVRRCGIGPAGVRLRVAVYAQYSGRTVRGFVRGEGVGPAQVACLRGRLRGLDLGVRLPGDDFIEWALRLGATPGGDEIRVLRPRRWVQALRAAARR
ncbi:MAG: hypothetical protein IPL40_00405 [Proteobacteria bacterium]|nr:hypothetical protein [Pseudomonadota bacterium]